VGYVEPHKKRGFLRFYQDVSEPQRTGTISFTFHTFKPWHQTGHQPFAWDLLPPVGARTYPIIRIVAAREVGIDKRVRPGLTKEGRLLGIVLGPRSPDVLVFRPQDDHVVPQPGEPIEPHRILGEPYRVGPDRSKGDFHQLFAVTVKPEPLKVQIRNVFGAYAVVFGIDHRKPYSPSAFAYELTVPEDEKDPLGLALRIVHTRKVFIKGYVAEDLESSFDVKAGLVHEFSKVPPQGSSLAAFEYHLKPVRLDVIMSEASKGRRRAIFLFELLITLIPFVGAVYDISQFVYAVATGEDFWGRDVSGGDFLWMGLLSVVSIAPTASVVAKDLRAMANARGIPKILDGQTVSEVRRVCEAELLEAVGRIDAASAKQLTALLKKYAAGELKADGLLRGFDDVLGLAYVRAIEAIGLRRAFAPDFRSFRNAGLAEGFNAYAASQRKKFPWREADPVAWALKQTGGRYAAELARELGPRWRDILKRERGRGPLREITPHDIAHYDRLAGEVWIYETLTKRNYGYGHLYEADHVLEKRFFINDPRVEGFYEKEGTMAFLVPKNAAVAARMPGNKITYVHLTRTNMLKALIPNGTETRFTVQQIWDAHCHVLNALGLDRPTLLSDRVKHMFEIIAEARKEVVEFRIPTPDVFLPEYGWPVLVGSGFP
jgi:hypothetical protein